MIIRSLVVDIELLNNSISFKNLVASLSAAFEKFVTIKLKSPDYFINLPHFLSSIILV